MLTTFTSRADGDVIMFGEVACRILSLLGKDPQDVQGIITVEQLPAAIATLEAAAEQDKRERETAEPETDGDEATEPERSRDISVSFSQRLVPLQTMLQHASRERTPVLWHSSGSRK